MMPALAFCMVAAIASAQAPGGGRTAPSRSRLGNAEVGGKATTAPSRSRLGNAEVGGKATTAPSRARLGNAEVGGKATTAPSRSRLGNAEVGGKAEIGGKATTAPSRSRLGNAEVGHAEIAAKANAAREAGRLEEAADLYRRGLKLSPAWKEGLWYLGTILYDSDEYGEARDVFRRYVPLQADNALAWALLGLCEFQTGEYDSSLAHLQRALKLGLKNSPTVQHVAYFHRAMILNQRGQHEFAWTILVEMSRAGANSPNVQQLAGLVGLRKTIFPWEIAPAERELVARVGKALWHVAEKRVEPGLAEFESLLEDYPETPHLHYTYASVLLLDRPDDGVKHLKAELGMNPKHVPALVALSVEYLKRFEMQEAIAYGEQAVAAGPDDFAAHAALGRALVEAGQAEQGARALEHSAKLAPDSPQVRLALVRAYNRLGRKGDAQREQAEFMKLKQLSEFADFRQP